MPPGTPATPKAPARRWACSGWYLSTPIVRAVSAKKRASKRSTELTTRSAATTAASRMASASVPLALNADMSSYPGARVCNRACMMGPLLSTSWMTAHPGGCFWLGSAAGMVLRPASSSISSRCWKPTLATSHFWEGFLYPLCHRCASTCCTTKPVKWPSSKPPSAGPLPLTNAPPTLDKAPPRSREAAMRELRRRMNAMVSGYSSLRASISFSCVTRSSLGMPGSMGPPGVTAAHCTRRSSRCTPLVSLKRWAREDRTSSREAFTVLGTGWHMSWNMGSVRGKPLSTGLSSRSKPSKNARTSAAVPCSMTCLKSARKAMRMFASCVFIRRSSRTGTDKDPVEMPARAISASTVL
mmetsp:Transcript_19848/g.51604  ORF Transcript_19848/g.51604 Transcript_19848/m.51604 type:complete len:355 (-) Transcript_19848:1766-2830(-)